MSLPTLQQIEAACEVVYRSMPATPQYSWPQLNERAGREVWIKHENHTPVGAFKIRGGLVYMDWLRREHPEVTTIVSATRGNHGQSLAYAGTMYGLRVVIVVPFGNSREKNAAMRALGAQLVEYGDDFQDASDQAAQLQIENSWHRIPSYDPLLVVGVATYALEFLRARPDLETVYVPLGMGSGLLGMLSARNALGLSTEVVGVVSNRARAQVLSFAAGQIIEAAAETEIADGVACRRPDPNALRLLRKGVKRLIEVDDDEVKDAMRLYFAATHNVAEGAGAIGLAALLKDQFGGRTRVGTVLCGGNVDSDVFAKVLTQGKFAAVGETRLASSGIAPI
jgi:threonine dehydratase